MSELRKLIIIACALRCETALTCAAAADAMRERSFAKTWRAIAADSARQAFEAAQP